MSTSSATARAERTQPVHVGDHLREWRQRRHLSQLDLAGDAEISARHLSFVETGRAAPSRDMVLKLAERLDVPLRERNVLLVAAGFAPAFPQRSLDDPALKSARSAIDLALLSDFILIQAQSKLTLADVLAALGRRDEAAAEARASLTLYESKGDQPSAAQARAALEVLGMLTGPEAPTRRTADAG